MKLFAQEDGRAVRPTVEPGLGPRVRLRFTRRLGFGELDGIRLPADDFDARGNDLQRTVGPCVAVELLMSFGVCAGVVSVARLSHVE